MDRFLDDAESMTSPTPAQSLLDRHRLNKPPNSVSMLSSTLNGTSDMQNGSPEIGGLVTSDLPQEASIVSAHNHVNSDVYAYSEANSEGGEPEVKKLKLDKGDLDNAVLQDLEKLISTDPVLHSQIDSLARSNKEEINPGHLNTTTTRSIRANPSSPPAVAPSGVDRMATADSVLSSRTIATVGRPTAEAVMQ